jgi:hypothetical protein
MADLSVAELVKQRSMLIILIAACRSAIRSGRLS